MVARYLLLLCLCFALLDAPGKIPSGVPIESCPPPVAPLEAASETPLLRLREGESVDLAGRIELSGDRAIFYPQDSRVNLRVLENLALERIAEVLSESRGDRQWVITGVITEYRGANYILVTKAIQRAAK
jgi:hypothetical protein